MHTDSDDYRHLLAGCSADVEVILQKLTRALYIPTEAVIEGDKVLVLNPYSRRLDQRRIGMSISNWDRTEVRHGFAADEQVVVSLDREGVEAGAFATLDGAAEQ